MSLNTMSVWEILSSAFLILLAMIHTSPAYRLFQAQIPNGGSVLNPCNNQSMWEGVGHKTKEGGSERNPFGLDFSLHGKTWNQKLCKLDSDGDGRSNGEELGDPDCQWKPGAVPKAAATSHPGVCEPITSEECVAKNSWLNCQEASTLELGLCGHLDKDTTFSKDLRLTATTVPAKETTYFCQMFDLNVTSDLHMVATQPLITASDVVHHILLFGCDPRADLDPERRSPYPCVMVPDDGCRSLIGAWTVGSPGECAHPEMGFRMGLRGYRTVALQIHWNNPHHLEGLVDTSGLRIHLTSNLRKNDAGMLVIGQRFMQIDPKSTDVGDGDSVDDVSFSATCPERCTQVMFKTPIYITSAVNHMHYLGKSQHIKVYKNNTVIKVVTDQHSYNYDDPVIYNFKDAIQVNPGEELRTTCVFRRPTTSNPVCWGEATSDEMCFGFITYYPLQSLSHPWCTSMKSFPSCDRHLPSLGKQPIGGCKWWEFRNTSHPDTKKMFGRIFDKCYPVKKDRLVCSEECRKAARVLGQHPCLQGELSSYMIDKLKNGGGEILLEAVFTCSCQKFPYCDRKSSLGVLGESQDLFCSESQGRRLHYHHIVLVPCVFIFIFLFKS